MASVNLHHAGPKLTKASLDAVQALIGAELPADYVAFLAKSNGGTADGYHFQLKRTKRYVNTFLSTRVSKRGPCAMTAVLQNCEGLIPSDSLPIAFADGANLILLRTKPRRYGQVDMKIDAETREGSPESGVVKLARTFSEFLERLQYTNPTELDEDDYGLW
jgi:hypothetical protein